MKKCQIDNITISGLYDLYSIDIPVENNQLILVGENGLGKSTVVTMLYHFLTKQWDRLVEVDFQCMSVTINDQVISISREDIKNNLRFSSNHMPQFERDMLLHFIEQSDLSAGELFDVFSQKLLECLSYFYQIFESFMIWTIFHRRAGHRPNLGNVTFPALCSVSTDLAVRQDNKLDDIIGDLDTKCGVTTPNDWRDKYDIIKSKLSQFTPKEVVRGKYELSIFIEFIKKVNALLKESVLKKKVTALPEMNNAITLLAPRNENWPAGIDHYVASRLNSRI